MFRYIVYRAIWLLLVFFLIVSIMYISASVAQYRVWTPRRIPIRDYIPIVRTRYIQYMINIFTSWDWGYERGDRPVGVMTLLMRRAPYTLRINFLAFIVYMTGGIVLGTVAALKHGTWIDRLITYPTLIIGAIPNYIWVLILMLFLGYRWQLLPPIPPSVEHGVIMRWKSYVIPVAALSFMPLSKFIVMMRGEVIEALDSEYTLLLKTKGLTHNQIIRKHLVRDCTVPLLPEIAPTFGFVLTGSFLVERINNIPGVSKLLFDSLFMPAMGGWTVNIDINLTVMVAAFYAFMGLLMVWLVDIFYAVLDPRIKMGSKR